MTINGGIRIGGIGISQGFDPDAAAFITTAEVTDATAKTQINDFVKGVKNLGLWSSMVSWPFRSAQNKGNGTTAYSLGGYGTYNGTLVNGPTWGTSGITFDGVNDYLSSSFGQNTAWTNGLSVFIVINPLNWSSKSEFYATIISNSVLASPNQTFEFLGLGTTSSAIRIGAKTSTTDYFYDGTLSNNTNTMIGFANNTSTTDYYINSSSPYQSAAGQLGTSTSVMNIGRSTQFGRYSNIISPFAVAFNTGLSTGQTSSFYTLYKTTLGTGLGLP